jgi:hypothetical protein
MVRLNIPPEHCPAVVSFVIAAASVKKRRPTMRDLSAPGMRAFRLTLAGVLALCVALACAGCVTTPPKIGYDCGTVQLTGGVDPTGPSRCLLDHYTHCQTATLVYLMQGVDTSETHTISVTPQGSSCAVTDADVLYVASFSRTTRQDYHCAQVSQRQGPLTLTSSGLHCLAGPVVVGGCGQEGDLVLPALVPRAPLLIGTRCGWVRTVNGGHAMDDATGPEACFWHAYTTCQPATLDVDGDWTSALPGSALVFTLVPQTSGCALYVQVTDLQLVALRSSQNLFTCTGLVRQHNGLDVPSCTEVGVAGGFSFGQVLPAT